MYSLTLNQFIHVIILIIWVLGSQGKPSLSFNLPGPFKKFQRNILPTIKNFSGKRVKNDSIRMVYFYDQTVAVVELEPDKLLLNCELIEVYEPNDAIKILGDIHEISRPVGITFNEMTKLMRQCRQLEEIKTLDIETLKNSTQHPVNGRGILANNPLVIFSGIIPGTKWCGTGDIANDYFDLGLENSVDRCCRAHDLCPVKIRSHSQRYNLTNDSLYTKSHCLCDDELFSCLRDNDSPTAHIMGNIYFNLVQVPCLEDTDKGRRYRQARNNF